MNKHDLQNFKDKLDNITWWIARHDSEILFGVIVIAVISFGIALGAM